MHAEFDNPLTERLLSLEWLTPTEMGLVAEIRFCGRITGNHWNELAEISGLQYQTIIHVPSADRMQRVWYAHPEFEDHCHRPYFGRDAKRIPGLRWHIDVATIVIPDLYDRADPRARAYRVRESVDSSQIERVNKKIKAKKKSKRASK